MNLDGVHLRKGRVKCIVDGLLRIVYEESLVSGYWKSMPDGGWI